MTKPASATWGSLAAPVHVEYVRSRRVLRLTGGNDFTGVVEVPLNEFLADLGIDIDQLAPPPQYLLFAAVGSGPGVSARHVVAAFVDEPDARDAFWALRMGYNQPGDWAEVASVEASGGVRRLCWFGTPWGPGGRESSGVALDATTGPSRVPSRAWRPAIWRRRTSVIPMSVSAE